MPQSQRNLVQIINAVQAEFALPLSTVVVGAVQDRTAQQLLAFAQAELEELGRRDNDWSNLTLEYNLVVSPPINTTGDTGDNSAVITNIPDTSGLLANFFAVIGSNIPVGARILSVDSPTQITMTMEATGAQAGASLLFARDMYPEPDDFDHFIGSTWWDRTNRWQLLGPMSAQTDQWHLSGIVATGPRRFFRTLSPFASNYRIWPPPAEIVNPLQLVYEYQTNKRVLVHGSRDSRAFLFANDDDIPLLDDRLIIAGIKWRYWESKGMNWLAKRKMYEDMVEAYIARDGGNSKMSLVRQPESILISPANVQDGFWPGPTGPNME